MSTPSTPVRSISLNVFFLFVGVWRNSGNRTCGIVCYGSFLLTLLASPVRFPTHSNRYTYSVGCLYPRCSQGWVYSNHGQGWMSWSRRDRAMWVLGGTNTWSRRCETGQTREVVIGTIVVGPKVETGSWNSRTPGALGRNTGLGVSERERGVREGVSTVFKNPGPRFRVTGVVNGVGRGRVPRREVMG